MLNDDPSTYLAPLRKLISGNCLNPFNWPPVRIPRRGPRIEEVPPAILPKNEPNRFLTDRGQDRRVESRAQSGGVDPRQWEQRRASQREKCFRHGDLAGCTIIGDLGQVAWARSCASQSRQHRSLRRASQHPPAFPAWTPQTLCSVILAPISGLAKKSGHLAIVRGYTSLQ